MKRWILCMVSLCLLVAVGVGLTLTASAAEVVASGSCGEKDSDVTWVLGSDGVLTISGTGAMASGNAPWYRYRDKIETATIEKGVTSIGIQAFNGCENLTSVSIPDSVTSIGNAAFYGCDAISAVYISSMEKWLALSFGYASDNPMFSGAALYLNGKVVTEAVFPDGTKEIGCTFSGCTSLTSITIPNSVTSIGGGALYGCANLTNITIPDSTTSIGAYAFGRCTSLTNITIPDSVTSISEGAFYYCTGLANITIPDSVTSIGGSAFEDCAGLTSITIPDSVTSIGGSAFKGCTGLTSITIPDSVTSIGNSAFYGCDAISAVYISSMGNWLALSFGNAEANPLNSGAALYLNGDVVTEAVFPDGTKEIGCTFSGCTSLTSITIPDSVTSIGGSAFEGCTGLTSITIPDGVTTIGKDAFYGCKNIEKLYYNAVHIADFASNNSVFGGAGAAGEGIEVIFGEGVKVIPAYLFAGRPVKIRNVTISSSVTTIRDYAFSNCYELSTLFFKGDLPTIASNTFQYVNAVALYPSGNTTYDSGKKNYGGAIYWSALDDSKEIVASGICGESILWQLDKHGVLTVKGNGVLTDVSWWSLYKNMINKIVFPEGITMTRIPIDGFKNYVHLKEFNVLPGVKTIGKNAFYGCTELTSITIPDSVTSIGEDAFYNCSAITAVYISSVERWLGIFYARDWWDNFSNRNPLHSGAALYLNGELLTDLVIPEGRSRVGNNAFCGCTSLKTVTIPDSVTSIGSSAFSGCNSILKVYISSMEKWLGITFDNDYSNPMRVGAELCLNGEPVTELVIPDNTNGIGSRAFQGCTSLTSVTLPSSVTGIGEKAFAGAKALKSVIFLGAKPVIGSDSFSSVSAEAYYPESLGSDVSWTQGGALAGYGGTLNWRPWWTLGNDPLCKHTLTDSVVPPSCTWGYTLHKCDCGYSYRTDFEPGIGHDMVVDAAVPATCTETGLTEGSHCSRCDYKIAQETVAALGHKYVDHDEKAPTCTTIGWKAYQTCERCDYTSYTELSALGHDMVVDAAVPATCTETGLTKGSHCSRCDYKIAQETVAALGHKYVDHAENAPACTMIGWKAYQTCERCAYTTYHELSALGHDMVVDAAVPATCTETGLTEGSHCSRYNYKVAQATVAALGHDLVIDPAVPATCTETGLTEGSHCARCDYKAAQSTVAALGHSFDSWSWKQTVAPTCTETGAEKRVCAACGTEETREVPALGHDWSGGVTWEWATDYSVVTASRTCKRDAAHTETELGTITSVVTVEATYDTEGEITYTATFANPAFFTDTRTQKTPRLQKPEPEPTPSGNPFLDVRDDSYYYDAVLWAVANNVTAGTSAATFSPDDGCTRAQVVTFLWRAAGMPEPMGGSNPFSDVAAGTYYYKAVLWAVEKGITAGTSATTFSPDDTCTRAQIVTFLWRYEGEPAPASANNPFSDVGTGDYFAKAVLWAAERGVTTGTSATTFSPEATCTRAQVVTFLHRDVVK